MSKLPLVLLSAAGLGSCAFGLAGSDGRMSTVRIVTGVLCCAIACSVFAWGHYGNG
jgi:hypothetical protein